MFRTIKLELEGDLEPLYETGISYTQACQIALNFGFKNKTWNKLKINTGTYEQIRNQIPQLPSGLIQCARDQASDMLKREKCKTLPIKKRLQMRYDNRTFKFYPHNEYVSLSTIAGRLNFKVKIYDYCRRYFGGLFTNATLNIKRKRIFINIQVKLPDVQKNITNRVLGIDRGIINIVSCDDNTFVNSKHLRAMKGKYQYLRSRLQSKGTRSAKRKLRDISGRERRFTLNTNHIIAKQLVNKPYEVYAVEALTISKRKTKQRRFNKKLGGWSYWQLLNLLKYKAENFGKIMIEVNPRLTSQRCSKCGYVDKLNRVGLKFRCLHCNFQLNADLNAARNIGYLGKSEIVRLHVNEPIVTHNGKVVTNSKE